MLKKLLVVTAVTATLIACGSNEASNEGNETNAGTASEMPTPAPPNASGISEVDADKGLTLIAQSDCLTCHKVEDRIVGPSYKEVANKYPANDSTYNYLAQKIIEGGKGVWGEVMMTPHEGLPKEDALLMAKYVMSLK
ncbi:MAG: c-type cytochrome [Chitinophagaceae bacterium]